MLMDQSLSTEQEIVYPAAYLTISIRQKFAQELARLQSQSIEELKVDIVKMASQYLTFTEDAWRWIDVEENRELLELVSMWIAIKNNELKFNQLRRILLESRALFSIALNIANNTDQSKILESLISKN
jgi:septum formation topological specificity factor MinE